MFKWFRRSTLDPLSVSMVGAKLADRILIVGTSDVPFIAALAVKAGLTGRTCIVDDASGRAAAAEQAALREGALVESFTSPYETLPFDQDAFDIVVLRALPPARASIFEQARRVLRGGGRLMIIHAPSQEGASALLEELKRAGFVAVRTLAEREGLTFVEAVKRSE
jgi:ubiquinone/menaquinone biosynthesis C-methylase UbiE